MMHGMTDSGNDQLVSLARSWINSPQLKITHGAFKNEGYDPSQRAYIISSAGTSEKSSFEIELLADEGSPVVNPAFLIKNWNKKEISLKIDGKPVERGKEFRFSQLSTPDGFDQIIWLKLTSMKKILIEFK
jgi:hypothetical protein